MIEYIYRYIGYSKLWSKTHSTFRDNARASYHTGHISLIGNFNLIAGNPSINIIFYSKPRSAQRTNAVEHRLLKVIGIKYALNTTTRCIKYNIMCCNLQQTKRLLVVKTGEFCILICVSRACRTVGCTGALKKPICILISNTKFKFCRPRLLSIIFHIKSLKFSSTVSLGICTWLDTLDEFNFFIEFFVSIKNPHLLVS